MKDCSVQISEAKAKELGVTDGDNVVLVGRRRHASYAKVEIVKKGKKSSCTITQNMAYNLRLRQDDKVKLVVLDKAFEEESTSERSGDLLLLQKQPLPIKSIIFSPIEDSLAGLTALEGGDTIPDSELQTRFITPYLESSDGALLKQGHLLVLRDENGNRLEFYVSNISFDGEDADENTTPSENEEGMLNSSFFHVYYFLLRHLTDYCFDSTYRHKRRKARRWIL